MIPIKEYEDDKYLFMATRNGIVKKTPIKDYENIRKNGLAAINLREDDKLIEVKVTDNSEDILLFTNSDSVSDSRRQMCAQQAVQPWVLSE